MKTKKIYYIETTLNGYIIEKTPICDYVKGKDYCGELFFKLDGEEIEYYNDIAGDLNDLDLFLSFGNNQDCEDYDDRLGTKSNVYLEYWKTLVLGYYDNKFIGIMVDL